MIWLLAEMHWHPSMALGREEEVERHLAALVAQLSKKQSNKQLKASLRSAPTHEQTRAPN